MLCGEVAQAEDQQFFANRKRFLSRILPRIVDVLESRVPSSANFPLQRENTCPVTVSVNDHGSAARKRNLDTPLFANSQVLRRGRFPGPQTREDSRSSRGIRAKSRSQPVIYSTFLWTISIVRQICSTVTNVIEFARKMLLGRSSALRSIC
jgi:hypothetical protein